MSTALPPRLCKRSCNALILGCEPCPRCPRCDAAEYALRALARDGVHTRDLPMHELRLSSRVNEPLRGYQVALAQLTLHARCPWCDGEIGNVMISETDGGKELTWECPEGCNP